MRARESPVQWVNFLQMHRSSGKDNRNDMGMLANARVQKKSGACAAFLDKDRSLWIGSLPVSAAVPMSP